MEWMKAELQRTEEELEEQRKSGERLRKEKQEVEERVVHLSRQVGGAKGKSGKFIWEQTGNEMISVCVHQVSVATEMMDHLKTDLQRKERELQERQQ